MSFFYGSGCLASKFPADFKKDVPPKTIVLSATAVGLSMLLSYVILTVAHFLQLSCAIDEYSTGVFHAIEFSNARYGKGYSALNDLVHQVMKDPYHAAKFEKNCRGWAKEGG